jgi:hypothetical protein
MPPHPLSEEQEREAQRLAEALRPQAEVLLQQVARLLAAHPGPQSFGAAEFQLRDLLLQAGAGFLQAGLAGKKTATRARRSPASAANAPPTSTVSGLARGSSACSDLSVCAARTTTAAPAAKAASPSTSRRP